MSELVNPLRGLFSHGDTVTISIYDSNNTKVVNAAACSELGLTGSFYYTCVLSPGGHETYYFIMTNGTNALDLSGEFEINSDIPAIKAKTDNLPASPAAVGSAMTLADDAITADKFDESTAYPVKSADIGITAIARVGADGDTLETLSDEISTRATLGAGGTAKVYTVLFGAVPIANCEVWATTDLAGSNVVASGITNDFGKVTFMLDSGTYYIWKKHPDYDFLTDPDIEVVP
jgi:hypothetical protein